MPNDSIPDPLLWSESEEKDIPESHRAYVRALLVRAYVRGQLKEIDKLQAPPNNG